MSDKKKTPKHLATLIDQHLAYCDWVDELIRVKATVPVENQAAHVQEGTPEKWIARAEGYAAALEQALFNYDCYAGFMYVGIAKKTEVGVVVHEGVGLEHPEFAEWRRLYFASGIKES